MAVEVETLIVRLEARVTDFEKQMDRARRKAQEASTSIGSTFAATNARIGRLLGVLGVGLSLAGITALIRKSVELGSSISDLSKKLGITAEQFQELSFAASQTATDQDAVVAGFRGMTQFLTAASRGGKEQVAVLKGLGLSFDDLKKKSPVQVFEILLDRAGKIQDPLRRSAILMQLFGRQGASLGALSLIGAAGMETLRNMAHDVGAVLKDETVESLDKAGDKLDQLGRQASTAGGELIAKLVPAITTMVDAISSPVFQSSMQALVEQLAAIVKFISDHPELVSILLGAGVGGKIGGAPGAIVGGIVGGVGATLPQVQSTPEFGRRMLPPSGIAAPPELTRSMNPAAAAAAATTAAKEEAAAVTDVAVANTKAATTSHQVADSVQDLLKLLPEVTDQFDNWGDVTDAQASKAEKVAADLAFEGEQLRRTAREQAAFNAVNQAGVEITSALGQAIAAQARANFDLAESIAQSAERMTELKDTARDVFQTIFNGIRSNQSASQILGTILDQLAVKFANLAFEKGLSALTSGTGGNFLSTLLGSVFGGFRAQGGPVQAGRVYEVGEKGREWFVPSVSGRITPQSGVGGGNVRHLIELVLTPEADARIRQVAGPQSRDISIAVVRANARQSARQQELGR